MAIEYDELHEHHNNNYEKYISDVNIKLEDFTVETGDFLDSKAGISLINDANIGQDVLLDNIKDENLDEQLSVGSTKNCDFSLEKIETIRVEICAEDENVPTLQQDPLLEDNQTHVKPELNEALRLKGNSTHTSQKKHNSDMVWCEKCNKMYGYQYYYYKHVRIHAGNTPYKCDICQRGFVRQTYLNTHKASHSTNKPYSCEICGRCYKSKGSLTVHQRAHSRSERDPCFPCIECGKIYLSKDKLRVHKISHDVDKIVSCAQCGKSFKGIRNKQALRIHITTHTGERPFTCEICKRSFCWKSDLKNHIKVHTGEKPFICGICKQSFAWPSSLEVHLGTHMGNCPYACDLCPAKFKSLRGLNRHRKFCFERKSNGLCNGTDTG